MEAGPATGPQEGEPEDPAASSPARLQPGIEDFLTDTEKAEAARVDRLAGDADLVEQLRAESFTGQDYNYAARELLRYGVGVLTSWLCNGRAYAVVFERLGY